MELGRLCVKLAGRDAGKVAVVVDHLEKDIVLIDGNVRRRKCNTKHLEPLDMVLKIKKGASHSEVADEFKKLKLPVWTTKPKAKKEKPQAAKKEVAAVKSEAKKEKPKEAPKKKAEKK